MKKNQLMKTLKKNNFLPKLVSLIIAILLWSYVMGVENPNETITVRNVRVNFLNVDKLKQNGLVLISPTEEFVTVKVSGKKNDLNRLSSNSIYATADLDGYKRGDSRVRVDTRFESNTGNIQIESVTPKDIVVTIDKIITRNMDVKIVSNGTAAVNHIIGDIRTSTPKVLLNGPQNLLDKVRSVETVVDITNKSESFTVSNPLKAIGENNEDIQGVQITPQVVDVSVPIFKTVILPIELSTTGRLPLLMELNQVKINPPSITLKVINENKIPEAVKTEEIDLSSITKNTKKEINVLIPEGLQPVDENAVYNLEVSINKYAIRKVQVPINNIKIENVPNGLEYEKENLPESVSLDLRGLDEEITNLDINTLNFVVDAKEAFEGLNHLSISLPLNDSGITINGERTLGITFREKNEGNTDTNNEDQ